MLFISQEELAILEIITKFNFIEIGATVQELSRYKQSVCKKDLKLGTHFVRSIKSEHAA